MTDRRIFTDEGAERFKASAGRAYRPSNGTEGHIFESRWCAGCLREKAYRETKDPADACTILSFTMAFSTDEAEYPTELVYGDDGQPRCTAFVDEGSQEPAYRCTETEDLFR